MTEQELRTLMGRYYPRTGDDLEVLLFRVGLFPNSINIYDANLTHLYDRTDDWFLVEQLLPELVSEFIPSKESHERFEEFVNAGNLDSIDWGAVYEYVDTICKEHPYYRNSKFIQTVEKYREQLLNAAYDIV